MPIGPIMMDLKGVELDHTERELLSHPLVGGVVLFTRNFLSSEQLQDLIFNIRSVRREPILVTVDHEGGRIQRFREGFTALPACEELGNLYNKNSNEALKFAQEIGWLMAAELLSVGIDMSFAPVLDLNLKISEVIGNRSFHRDPDVVIQLATAYIQGMNQAGMAAIGKHFPGHGSVKTDSHIDIPIDPRDFNTILHQDLLPFAKMAPNLLSGIMPAHITYSKVDEKPATFSSIWLKEVLRQQLHFCGAIISDDLSMAGASVMGDITNRAKAALDAGCDMILLCNDPDGIIHVIENLQDYANQLSSQRLIKLCGYFQYTRKELVNCDRWNNVRASLKSFGLCSSISPNVC